MRRWFFLIQLILAAGCSVNDPRVNGTQSLSGDEVNILRLCPDNFRYLEYKGEPTILITSAEHYGAVVNLDFDYKTYLESLEQEGFNYSRIFCGTYIEPVDNIFGIEKNTLAPLPDRFLAPWEKENGKYNLTCFNQVFFNRLKDFVSEAEKRGILVEVTLFTSIYAQNSWELSPFQAKNNVNGVGNLDYHQVNTLFNEGLDHFQENFIRKIVNELNEFDNLFFEIQNEPWADNPNLVDYVNMDDSVVFSRTWQKKVEVANGVSMEWQNWVASVITDEESRLPKKHLIAQNISNFQFNQEQLPEMISIINFHYALPDAATINGNLEAVTGLDETGFMPHKDGVYINQAWRFILSGGGLYNNLDYSYTTGNEKGNWTIPESNPGWGGPVFRRKLSYLVNTIKEVPFHEMEVTNSIITDSKGLKQYGLQKPGEVYLVFLEGFKDNPMVPQVPGSDYNLLWLNVDSGEKIESTRRLNGNVPVESPFEEDQVVLLMRRSI